MLFDSKEEELEDIISFNSIFLYIHRLLIQYNSLIKNKYYYIVKYEINCNKFKELYCVFFTIEKKLKKYYNVDFEDISNWNTSNLFKKSNIKAIKNDEYEYIDWNLGFLKKYLKNNSKCIAKCYNIDLLEDYSFTNLYNFYLDKSLEENKHKKYIALNNSKKLKTLNVSVVLINIK